MSEFELRLFVNESVMVPIRQTLSPIQLEQLVWYSQNDPSVLENTHDKERFATVEQAREWFDSSKAYVLTDSGDEEGNLKGIIWFQRSDLPKGQYLDRMFEPRECGITFAIRLYGGMRGKNIANKFIHLVLTDLVHSDFYRETHARKIWLSVKSTNFAALRSYEKSGFRQISDLDSEGRLLMIYDPVTEVRVERS